MPHNRANRQPGKESQSKSRKLAFAAIVIGLTVAVAIAELAVRLLLPSYSPDTVRRHSMPYVAVPYAGYLIEPVDRLVDLDAEKAWGRKPEDAPSDRAVYINAKGYRGPNISVEKPPGVTRIVVLGASSVFDQNVSDTLEDNLRSWPHRVQAILQSSGFGTVEVINAGVPGHNSANSLGRLYTQLWHYEPDYVLIYHGWNDIKYWRRLAVTAEQPLIRQISTLDTGDNPFMNYRGALDRFLGRSQFYIRLRSQYFRWRYRPDFEGAQPNGQAPAGEFGELGPRQFRLNIALLIEASRAIGANPVLLTQATLVTADSPPADRERIGYHYQALSHDALVRAFDRTYRTIRELADETGTPVIDVATSLNGHSDWFADHVHTSETGSAALARVVAEGLVAILSQGPATPSDESPASEAVGAASSRD